MYIQIEKKDNGFLLRVKDSLKYDGEKVFKSTEAIELATLIGTILCEKKVKAEIL